ncbi:zinc-ribbon family protein [Lentzea fradiae]|uniref:Zinc-ribbon family protein n=1 Tax=Lentzea fradiae TaxID=200378 RepID=A0A1G7QC48_9PSEU|nr:zinc-ribbon domain-containing protein [Lentzea fradiae]SDF96015.1 zinc-ribbon family protein [Lentzea fradiae]
MVIFGWRTTIEQLRMLRLVCGNCHHQSAHHLYRRRTRPTLFFIPLFTISSKYGLQCTFCGVSYDITKMHADQLVG